MRTEHPIEDSTGRSSQYTGITPSLEEHDETHGMLQETVEEGRDWNIRELAEIMGENAEEMETHHTFRSMKGVKKIVRKLKDFFTHWWENIADFTDY